MSELKRCPFCGEESEIDEIFEQWDGRYYEVTNIRCTCGALVRVSEFEEKDRKKRKEKSIEKWNTRKPLERIVERLEELHEESATDYYDWEDISYLRERDAYQKAIEIVKEEGGLNE